MTAATRATQAPEAEPENSGKYREYAAALAKLAAGRLVAGDLDTAREALTEALGWCEVMRYLASLERRAVLR